jgi:hypothetical protein
MRDFKGLFCNPPLNGAYCGLSNSQNLQPANHRRRWRPPRERPTPLPIITLEIIDLQSDDGLCRVRLRLDALDPGVGEFESDVTVSEYGLARYRRFASVARDWLGLRLPFIHQDDWQEMIDKFEK